MSAGCDLRLAVSGGAETGLGHVMRGVELAREARARGLDVRFALDGDARAREVLAAQLPDAPVERWIHPADLAAPARWVAFDTRGEIGADLRAARAAGVRCLVLDRLDCADAADLTVLPVLHAPDVSHPRVLAGPPYCVIGADARACGAPPYPGTRDAVLVTLGGADPRELTARLAQPLDAALTAWPGGPHPRVHCALGPAFRDRAGTAAALAARGWTVHDAPSRRELLALMGRALYAVAGFGTSVYDLAFLGVPLLTLAHRDSDAADARRLERRGIGRLGGTADAFDPRAVTARLREAFLDDGERLRASRRGRGLIGDGEGARRILDALFCPARECAA